MYIKIKLRGWNIILVVLSINDYIPVGLFVQPEFLIIKTKTKRITFPLDR